MTCENQVAVDLFAVSHVIDVRLLKVTVFGKNAAAATPPFTMADRSSYHMKEWVARALWVADGHARELPLSDKHRLSRWRIKLNGKLLKDPKAEITHSFAEPGMAHMVRGASVDGFETLFPIHVIFSTMCVFSRSVQQISPQWASQTRRCFMARSQSPNSAQNSVFGGCTPAHCTFLGLFLQKQWLSGPFRIQVVAGLLS